MDNASEAILALQPVTFRYKKKFDPTGAAQFGLVAEDVEKVDPDLVVRDKEGKPYTVRYGERILIADAHRDDGKRFVVLADEKLTALVELESTIRSGRTPRGVRSA